MGRLSRIVTVLTFASLVLTRPAAAQFDALRNLTRGGDTEEQTKQIAFFKIKGALAETPVTMPPLFGGEPPASLKSMLERFKEARLDSSVVAVIIDLQEAALGFAQLQEIHESLRKFAAVDKEVFVHADSLRMGSYAVATGASHVSIVPTGDLWLTGLYGETPYLRGTLDKLGCVPDFEHCGDFKTGAESITRTGPSEASSEMTKWLIDGIYEDLVQLIADSRGMTPAKVRELIDNGPYNAEEALANGLIDSVKHRQDFIADIKKRFGASTKVVSDYGKKDAFDIPDDNFFAMVEFLMKMLNPSPKVYTEPSVAIVYVEGAIQTGKAETNPFGSSSGAFSTSIRRALDKAAEDPSVKAVVLRVDSPGGSALASEIILNATQRVVDAGKPLIVSMGNVAGSGGYYVTCASDTIFAQSGTITASIGVLGGKLVTTGMWDKLGVNWHPVQRGKMASMLSTSTSFSDAERAKIRHYMETVYDIFKGHVVAARKEHLVKPIDELAGGRVFTGRQALKLGLVDKIGGLEDSIKFAAQRAGLSEYDVRVIPEPPSIFDLFGGHKGDDEYAAASVGERVSLTDLPLIRQMLPVVGKLDPLRAAAILRALQRIELIHNEGVVMMMPDELVIR